MNRILFYCITLGISTSTGEIINNLTSALEITDSLDGNSVQTNGRFPKMGLLADVQLNPYDPLAIIWHRYFPPGGTFYITFGKHSPKPAPITPMNTPSSINKPSVTFDHTTGLPNHGQHQETSTLSNETTLTTQSSQVAPMLTPTTERIDKSTVQPPGRPPIYPPTIQMNNPNYLGRPPNTPVNSHLQITPPFGSNPSVAVFPLIDSQGRPPPPVYPAAFPGNLQPIAGNNGRPNHLPNQQVQFPLTTSGNQPQGGLQHLQPSRVYVIPILYQDRKEAQVLQVDDIN